MRINKVCSRETKCPWETLIITDEILGGHEASRRGQKCTFLLKRKKTTAGVFILTAVL